MPDRLIGGRYRIDGLLSEGGVARISTAMDSLTGESVIIKEPISHDPSSRQAIIKEYEFIRLHPHPSVVPANCFMEENEQAFIVMPFVDGEELKNWFSEQISRADRGSRRPILDSALASILECAAFVHFCGQLYNDFKPDNFLVVRNSGPSREQEVRPVLLDFNLICDRNEHPPRRGTLAYISPEILKGEAPSAASDLYSLGATIFELLSGNPPYVSTDSEELIKLVSEAGSIDYSGIPSFYRDGLVRLLSVHPENRPGSAREAAALLGVETVFDELFMGRLEWYLAAGPPPFADRLKSSLKEYLKDSSSSVFLASGMSHNASAWNFMTCLLETEGWEIQRVRPEENADEISSSFDNLERRIGNGYGAKLILVVDDYEILAEDDIRRMTAIIRSDRNIPMVIGTKRWCRVDLPFRVFDPLTDSTCGGAAAESLKALLKKSELRSDYEQLSDITGGDPELVYLYILEIIRRGGPALLIESELGEIQIPTNGVPGVDRALERMCSLLEDKEQVVMDRLSAWGFKVPLLLLADLDSEQRALVDRLVQSRFLIREKDAVAFPSGAAANLFYSHLSRSDRLFCHRFWAEAAEKRLEDSIERLEMMAVHWGRSDDRARGFRANIEAATDSLRSGSLSPARNYAETALALAREGAGPVSPALSVSADVARMQGRYADARRQYIELLTILRRERDDALKAKSLRELGDTYRSLKEAPKAISYAKRAMKLYARLSDDQGVADCHNSIGLAGWVQENYEAALVSFESAAEINRRLGNHRELARIETNQGIMKDMVGRTGEVKEHFLTALENAKIAGDNRQEALISNNLGFFMIRRGEFEEAILHLKEALRLSEQIGYSEEIINSLTNLGLSYLRLGDLLQSVDCNQRARDLAISFGSKHLAADAELNLIEACIMMGNYGLADTILGSIESSGIYDEDRILKLQVDLLRSKWLCSLGDFSGAFRAASVVSLAAERSANKRLRLEADITAAAAVRTSSSEAAVSRLASVVEECQMLGHSDLLASAGLLMGEIYSDSGDGFSSESWLEKTLSTPNLPIEVFIRASILSAEMLKARGEFDTAIERLGEMENLAAEKGFVLLALRSSVVQGEILSECGKFRQAENGFRRAQGYRERIVSALPDTLSADLQRQNPLMARLSSGLAGVRDKSLLKI
jgi:serine/threonine protein kinase/tetratricopeptide (TPR) repeat protein